MVLIEGRTLKETLLLNLMPYSPDDGQPRTPAPTTARRGKPTHPDREPDERYPSGWTDLLDLAIRGGSAARRAAGTTRTSTRSSSLPERDCPSATAGQRMDGSLRRPEISEGRVRLAAAHFKPR